MLDNAKALRSNQTEAEQQLWYQLRAHRFMRLKFKRQKPIGRYVVDFVCLEHRLIVEVDGGQHAEQIAYDQHRDAWLRSRGYTVLRFWNNEVMQQLDSVLERISSSLSPGLSPAGGREEMPACSSPCASRKSAPSTSRKSAPSTSRKTSSRTRNK